MSDTILLGFVYDENRVNDGVNILEAIKSELDEIDDMLYDATMKISYAKGFDKVEKKDKSIDIRMPEEKVMDNKEDLYNMEGKLSNLSELIKEYSATGSYSGGGSGSQQGVQQGSQSSTQPQSQPQQHYTVTNAPQTAAPQGPQPTAPQTAAPAQTTQPAQPTQPPAVQGKQEGLLNNTLEKGAETLTAVPTSSVVPSTSVVEKSAIPDTSQGNGKAIVASYAAPAALGILAGGAGIVGAHKMRKKEEKDEEELLEAEFAAQVGEQGEVGDQQSDPDLYKFFK